METVRAFVCVELSEEARMHLGGLQDRLRRHGARVSWVAPSNMHLTLAFLGDTPAARLPEIATVVDGAAVEGPVRLSLQGVGGFPSLERARVFWVGLDGEVDAVRALQSRVASGLRALGVEWDEKPFSPHVTLGRVKDPRDPGVRRVAAGITAAAPEPIAFTVDRLVLMRSELLPGGARYTPLHVAPLLGA